MTEDVAQPNIMVLGIGNVLHGDDGVGIHVIRALLQRRADAPDGRPVALLDGGTIGLALLAEIEDAGALIVIDAAEFGAEPGTVRIMIGAEMDAQLGGRKRTVHEVALADLMTAATLIGRRPERRALVAIQPSSTDWMVEPTACVASAIPEACNAVLTMIERWDDAD
ncbi:MAG: hydrogenase maturation protease [Devosia sp.]|nr:hydrogenase maturation protease [Devosia sp.]